MVDGQQSRFRDANEIGADNTVALQDWGIRSHACPRHRSARQLRHLPGRRWCGERPGGGLFDGAGNYLCPPVSTGSTSSQIVGGKFKDIVKAAGDVFVTAFNPDGTGSSSRPTLAVAVRTAGPPFKWIRQVMCMSPE